ncbi:sensor histidine kinase [Sediminispirochaeta bajacaliforniensis]|uniref:sensor histidine kinase n=1 Tax=Sediminispirochaeta bajacaliforniensis TaxID=148 RepID=UPI0003712C67|nr:sensor histidine kinase [Sediminispirochaeta bajacaliforniensis]
MKSLSDLQATRRPFFRAAVAILILLLYLIAFLLFISRKPLPEDYQLIRRYGWHFRLLLVAAAANSMLLFFSTGRDLLTMFRIALFFLIAYPLGLGDEISVLMLFSLLTEIALYHPFRNAVIYMLLSLLVALGLGRAGSAFYLTRAATPMQSRLFIGIIAFLYASALLTARWAISTESSLVGKVRHLNSVIDRLSEANLDFQRYVHSVEYSAVNSERRRLSREIHDSVGYSLTNILMTLEAAKDLMESNGVKARDALDRSISEARSCLEETRRTMRRIRSEELRETVGLQAIAHLTRSFSEGTGMHISVEYGNAPESLGAKLDLVLFRIVQEGLTNAFRHGMASQVRITLWVEEGVLLVTVSDNGKGSEEVVDGLGLSGMRERVKGVGGSVDFRSGPDGFRVQSMLPLDQKE